MKNITAEKTVVRSQILLSTQLDGEVILMELHQGRYYGLATTARRIWQEIGCPRQVSELITTLALEYGVDAQVCGPEIIAFLEDLYEEHLIDVS